MSVTLNPYLSFRGQARDALEFYQSVFGGELTISTFAEFGMSQDPAEGDNVMHGQLNAPNVVLMAADMPAVMPLDSGSSITVSLSGDDGEALHGYWDKLSDGATIGEPLAVAPWGDEFGSLTDKFGTAWMVNIAGAGQAQG